MPVTVVEPATMVADPVPTKSAPVILPDSLMLVPLMVVILPVVALTVVRLPMGE